MPRIVHVEIPADNPAQSNMFLLKTVSMSVDCVLSSLQTSVT